MVLKQESIVGRAGDLSVNFADTKQEMVSRLAVLEDCLCSENLDKEVIAGLFWVVNDLKSGLNILAQQKDEICATIRNSSV